MARLRPCLHKSRETRQASAGRRSTTQAERIAHRAVRTSSPGTATSGSRGAGYPQLAATEQDRGPLGWLQITMKPAHEDLADRITTRKDLATFLDALSAGGIEHGSHWENLQIFDMLEAMAAWLLRVVVDRALSSRWTTLFLVAAVVCAAIRGGGAGARFALRSPCGGSRLTVCRSHVVGARALAIRRAQFAVGRTSRGSATCLQTPGNPDSTGFVVLASPVSERTTL